MSMQPSQPAPAGALERILRRVVLIEREETAAVAIGFAYLFLAFTSYGLLRPIRETAGITGGVDNLQWLWTGTWLTMLAAMPLFGLVSAKFRRIVVAPWVNLFFTLNLVVFGIFFYLRPDDVWLARAFYIWLSVFNLFVISVAWSVLVDAFRAGQAKRVFPFMAGGMSTGNLVGAWSTTFLVESIGQWGLIALSTVMLASTVICVRYLFRWRAQRGAATERASLAAKEDPQRAIGGNPLAGLTLVLKSPYLLGIAGFVMLLTAATTFLYFDQARFVEAAYPDKDDQTQWFGTIDGIVNTLALFIQLLLTGHIASRLGLAVLLSSVPLLMVGGFLTLSMAPVLGVLAVVMVIRRVGEYALLRPGREMLFSIVDAETKYKAKNFIDTFVYRTGDLVSGWFKAGLDALGHGSGWVALFGAALAAVWASVGFWLGRKHERALVEGAVAKPAPA